jgi:hypothetical protein
VSERYFQHDGKLFDGYSNTVIPFDLYWVVDLLNLKEDRIQKLEEELNGW